MKIFLTFDYELFFGANTGSVEKCMLTPTRHLFEIAKQYKVKFTFFVDIGYIIQASKYPELANEVQFVKEQVSDMIVLGHDVQLHIHPHWERAIYNGKGWEMNVKGSYKLIDFKKIERETIIKTYKSKLEEIIGKKVTTYRAGGWCIQPFDELKDIFKELEIRIDSSVIPGEYIVTEDYNANFISAPRKSHYRFSDDVCNEDDNGYFTEFPIASYRYSPSFFWMLYLLGKLFPLEHKMIGDGSFLNQGNRKFSVLTGFTNAHVSTDGYFSKKLDAALEKYINIDYTEMVVIGHPKGNTKYSLKKLEKFIQKNNTKHEFVTFESAL